MLRLSLWEFGAVAAGFKKANEPTKSETLEAPSDEEYEALMNGLAA